MKNSSKVLLPSEYAPLGAGLPGVRARLDAYEDLVPYFPVKHLDEVDADGKLCAEERLDTHGFTVDENFAIGGGFHMETPDLRYYAQDAGDVLHRLLSGALSMVRMGERLQFQWLIQDVMDPVYKNYATLNPDDPPFVKFFRTRRFDLFRRQFEAGSLRHFTAACFLQVPYGGKVLDLPRESGLAGRIFSGIGGAFSGAFSAIGTSAKSVYGPDLLTHLYAWRSRLGTFEQSMSQVPGLILSPAHSTDYIRWYRRLLSPDMWGRMRAGEKFDTRYDNLDSAASVAAQCVTGRLADKGSYFVTGSYYHRILTIEIPPKFVEMGYLMTAITRREVLESIRNIHVTLNLTPRSRERELSQLRRKRDFMQKQLRADPNKVELIPVIDGLNAEISSLDNNDISTLFSVMFVIHFWDRDPNRMSQAEELLTQQLRVVTTTEMGGEEMVSLPYFLSYCLPGCPGKGDRYRLLPMRNDEVAPLVPLLGRGAGILARTRNPVVPTLYSTDLGTPFSIDLFARNTVVPYNGLVVGGSGSGKSFLFNNIVSSYGNRKTRVLIIDAAVGTPSFRAMCDLMGGVYIDKGFRFNALGTRVENGVVRSPDEDELTGILATLEAILRTSEAEVFTNVQRSFLSGAVNYLFQNLPPGGVPYLRHLPDAIRNYAMSYRDGSDYKKMAEQFSQVLEASWCSPGGDNVNARYVDGPDETLDSWLTVFDLKWVLGRRDLLTVFMMLIFRHIARIEAENNKKPDTERETILIGVDEGWKVLFDPAFAGVFDGVYRAGRARNMAIFFLTQKFTDFLTSLRHMFGAGEQACNSSVLSQSSHFFVASLDVNEAQAFGATMNLPESQWQALTRLRQEPGRFSEYGYFARVIGSPEFLFARLRYAPLPEELWAFTSNSMDDGKRLRVMAEVRSELQSSASREKFLVDMANAGWDRDGLARLDLDSFVRHAAIFRLAEDSR